jgi:chromosome segregation ATPase
MSEAKRRTLLLNYDSEATKRIRGILSRNCEVTTADSLKDIADKADKDFDVIITGYVVPAVSGDKPVSYLKDIQKALDEVKVTVREKRDANEALLKESQEKWAEILKLLDDHIRGIENEKAELKQKMQSLMEEANTARKREEDAEKKAEAAFSEKSRTEEELAEIREKDAEVIAKLNDQLHSLTKELENSISLAEEANEEKARIENKLTKLQENWEKYVAGQ